MYLKILLRFGPHVRNHSSVKLALRLDDNVLKSIGSNELHPKKHPGTLQKKCSELPKNLKDAILSVTGDTPLKVLIKEGISLSRYLHKRKYPLEQNEFYEKKREIRNEILNTMNVDFDNISEEQTKYYNTVLNSKVDATLKQRVYNWQPIDYTMHTCLQYMVARSAAEYAVISHVFKEIKMRMGNFQPYSLFDFGSGVGTTIWAANNLFGDSLKEIFCVDSSGDMNELSRSILERLNDKNLLNKIYQRQFLPSSNTRLYDIVVSAYSLFELPSVKSRLQTILNLWLKTKSFLVLIEQGTSEGFDILNEARDFILHCSHTQGADLQAHIFAPCPHEMACPRATLENSPCNYSISYITYPQKPFSKEEIYSYLVVQRGKRSDEVSWPRIVKPVLLRSRHSICRLCTPSGSLEDITFTAAKHGKELFRCAKSSKWGDRLPVSIEAQKKEMDRQTELDENKSSLKMSCEDYASPLISSS